MMQLPDCPEDGAAIEKMERNEAPFGRVTSHQTAEGFYIHRLLHRQICIICNLNVSLSSNQRWLETTTKRESLDKDVEVE